VRACILFAIVAHREFSLVKDFRRYLKAIHRKSTGLRGALPR
jgi:hypothetical protein